jgi:hypothetical protein
VTVNSANGLQFGKLGLVRMKITGTGITGTAPTFTIPFAAASNDEWFVFTSLTGSSFFGDLYFTVSGTTLTAYSATFTTGTVYTFVLSSRAYETT